MRTGNRLFLIAYVMVCLLSGTHSAGMPINEQAIIGMWEYFASFGAKEEQADEACLFVAYALNGGMNHEDNKTIIYKSDLPVTLGVPTREGYNFAGWYLDKKFRHKVTELNSTFKASEIVLFAKWTEEIDNYYNVEMYSYKTRMREDKSRQKTLTDCEYYFWDDMYIPGMPQTRESDYLNNYITQATQCMQGLCFTPEYILMTSYAESDVIPGMLMIFDRESGEYLVSLTMKVNSHLGGVIYDGKNIWICHSKQKTLERIDYGLIQKIVKSGAKHCVDIAGISKEYQIKNTPSCITFYGDRIWVATHTSVFDGTMVSYSYDESMDKLFQMAEYKIPKEVQGIAFDDEDGSIYFSTSYGRKNSSYLKAYTSLAGLMQNPDNPSLEIEMPPCSEGVACEEGSLLVLFESASEKYFEGTDGNGVSKAPLDTLLEIEIASLW